MDWKDCQSAYRCRRHGDSPWVVFVACLSIALGAGVLAYCALRMCGFEVMP